MGLCVRLLGTFQAEFGGEDLHIASKRGRAMLAVLALSPGRRISRQGAAALLWPDRDEPQARASLRQELSSLRKALGPAETTIRADTETITMDGGVDLDVWSVMADRIPCGEALDLFRGEILDGIDLPLEPFEEWLADQRRVFRGRLVGLAEQNIRQQLDRGDLAAAEECAGKLLQIDTCNEIAVAARMRNALANGRRLHGLSLFDDFAARLDAEFQAKPGPELTRLREEIAGAKSAGAGPTPNTSEATLFDRPSVLVMGFDCLSASADDRMLAIGLVDEMRMTLSYWRWFPVIGPEAIGWKSVREADIRSAAREVAASYAVCGSLRHYGDTARITVTLADATTGESLWSQNFDGEIKDIFDFQEVVSRSIVAQLEPQIARAEAERIARKPPVNLAAWHLVTEADELERLGGGGYGTPEGNAAQLRLLERATGLEPGYARAWTRIAKVHWRFFLMGWDADRDGRGLKSEEASKRAIALDPNDWEAHSYQALIQVFGHRDYRAGEYHSGEAVRLNPSAALARHAAGCTLEWLGRPEEALRHLELVFRLNPDPPHKGAVLGDLSTCYMLSGRLDEAVEAARRLMAAAPDYSRGLQRCIATFGLAGRGDLAAEALARLRKLQPDFSEDYVRSTYPFRRGDDFATFMDGLRRAGCWA
ncbi:BTAD domain-containing putative transcriptional regulator [Oricola cellulosilytica]|uniref:Tetratricopeptide repeat protein n=1 Tax=Oricola cellulosilytica TaxID=1429082 RepID=A0A4R0PA91_9HYPH|nr:BTAD domain-containing putative transcriptional regulator [Oricola cellulosilytica]TCD14161.1 tetratricopeptide repeat protein [Oricola cellulosilytica]